MDGRVDKGGGGEEGVKQNLKLGLSSEFFTRILNGTGKEDVGLIVFMFNPPFFPQLQRSSYHRPRERRK